ncbi:MAG: diheme cytochrome C [Cyanobacteria bacterium P01_D01_bin.128]
MTHKLTPLPHRVSQRRRSKWRSLLLLSIALLCSLCVGTGLAQALEPAAVLQAEANVDVATNRPTVEPSVGIAQSEIYLSGALKSSSAAGTVDIVSEEHHLGQELYLENCATCHIGIPPAVLPSQVWEVLINDVEHYGVTLTLPSRFDSQLILNYLVAYSRPYYDSETLAYNVARSRFFQALHPRVDFSTPVSIQSCGVCHPGASEYNFRQLEAEWADAE